MIITLKHTLRNRLLAAVCSLLIAGLLAPTTAAGQEPQDTASGRMPVELSSHTTDLQFRARYADIPQDTWYEDAVWHLHNLYNLFYRTECREGFCPQEPIKRQTMAVWTVRLLDGKDPTPATKTRFNDVPLETDQDKFIAGFINRLYELGVTTGCGDGSGYCPEEPVTRAQMAVFLTRTFDLSDGPEHGFEDIPDGAWYTDQVSALKASGITTGCGDNTGFCPSDPTSRAQMAVFLYRAIEADILPRRTASVDRVAPPLERCAQSGYPHAGRASVRIGFAGGEPADIYDAVARDGPNSCEKIMNWWNEITKVEAERANDGDHPCEYPVSRSKVWDKDDVQRSALAAIWNGPAVFVQCWPVIRTGWKHLEELRATDPDLYADALDILQYEAVPPSTRPMLEAVWACYRSALQGPDPGEQYATTVNFCNNQLMYFGPAVRFGGVTDECAARNYIGRFNELIANGLNLPTGSNGHYAGDYSWSNCETHASRLIPDELADAPYTQRCEAMVDAAADADTRTDTVAARGGGTREDLIAVVKAMYCEGTREAVRTHAHKLQKYLPDNWERDYWRASEAVWGDRTSTDRSLGQNARFWAGIEGTPCFEAALLVNARHAVLNGDPFSKVKYC